MKKVLLWVGGIVVVFVVGFWGWYSFLRPQSARVLDAKRQAYGEVVFTVSRWDFSSQEDWEFRTQGVVYTLQEAHRSGGKFVRLAQYGQFTTDEQKQIQEVAVNVPKAARYGCPPPELDSGDGEGVCLTQGGMPLRLAMGSCSIYSSCRNFFELNNPVNVAMGATLVQLLAAKGVHGFGTNMWVSLDAESDWYFTLTAYAPYGFALGILILIVGLITRRRKAQALQGLPAQPHTRLYRAAVTVGYTLAILCALVYLFDLIWQPMALRVVS